MIRPRVFSEKVLHSGIRRTIGSLPARNCIAISRWRDDEPCGRLLVFGREAPIVRAAIEAARDPNLGRRRDMGGWKTSSGLEIVCWAWRRADGARLVALGRVADGQKVGGVTHLEGEELEALELALDHLDAMQGAA